LLVWELIEANKVSENYNNIVPLIATRLRKDMQLETNCQRHGTGYDA